MTVTIFCFDIPHQKLSVRKICHMICHIVTVKFSAWIECILEVGISPFILRFDHVTMFWNTVLLEHPSDIDIKYWIFSKLIFRKSLRCQYTRILLYNITILISFILKMK